MDEFQEGVSVATDRDLKLTLSEDTASLFLEQDMQKEACRGICQDIIMTQLECAEDLQIDLSVPSEPLKQWPLVVVDRESPPRPSKTPPPVRSRPSKRNFLRAGSFARTAAAVVPVSPCVENVDLVFVDQDEDSCAIEVCSSPSDKISDLHSLQQRGIPETR